MKSSSSLETLLNSTNSLSLSLALEENLKCEIVESQLFNNGVDGVDLGNSNLNEILPCLPESKSGINLHLPVEIWVR